MAGLADLLSRGRMAAPGLPQVPQVPEVAPIPQIAPPPPPARPPGLEGLAGVGQRLDQRLGQLGNLAAQQAPNDTPAQSAGMESLLAPYSAAVQGLPTTIPSDTEGKVADRIAQLQGLNIGPGSGNADGLLGLAKSQVGVPYVFGSENPMGRAGGRGAAFDCSGFTKWLFAKRGVNLPHQALQQAQITGTNIKKNQLRPGDLLYYSYGRLGNQIDHVAVYYGNGKAIGAAPSSNGVGIAPVDWSAFVGGGRVGGGGRRGRR